MPIRRRRKKKRRDRIKIKTKQSKKSEPAKSHCGRHSIQWFMPQRAKKEVFPPRPFLAFSPLLFFHEVVDPSWPSNFVAHSYFAIFFSCVFRICLFVRPLVLVVLVGFSGWEETFFGGYWGCSFFSGRGRVFWVDLGSFLSQSWLTTGEVPRRQLSNRARQVRQIVEYNA